MKWILFGTGMASRKLMSYALQPGEKIVAVVDNNSQNGGITMAIS